MRKENHFTRQLQNADMATGRITKWMSSSTPPPPPGLRELRGRGGSGDGRHQGNCLPDTTGLMERVAACTGSARCQADGVPALREKVKVTPIPNQLSSIDNCLQRGVSLDIQATQRVRLHARLWMSSMIFGDVVLSRNALSRHILPYWSFAYVL